MDKELLRLVIVLTGAIVIVGLLIWSFLLSKKRKRGINFYDEGDPLDKIDDSLVIHTEDDEFDIVPLGSAKETSQEVHETIDTSEDLMPMELQPAAKDSNMTPLPDILQFSLAAKEGDQFEGRRLVETLTKVGLEFGSIKVFERLDENNNVNFTVANMVEPGIFPDAELESFNSPGIVFFMQREIVKDSIAVFDDLINTMQLIAQDIGGEALDQHYERLTPYTIRMIRDKLQNA